MLRIVFVGIGLAVVTLILVPLQWLAVALQLRPRRTIPVLFHRIVCAMIGVRVRVIGERTPTDPLLVVANHASWLDISVISSITPAVFVAKHEIASWPLFGVLAKLQRSVFVDRGRRQKTGEVNAEIAQRLAEGDPVVLFGEGTSSDGNRVLPFRSALIGGARDALASAEHTGHVAIQPLSIAYTGLQGIPMGRQLRPLVAWYGDTDLVPHLVGVLRRGGVDVVVTWGAPIAYDGEVNRKAVAKSLETTVRRLTSTALRGRIDPEVPGARHSLPKRKKLKKDTHGEVTAVGSVDETPSSRAGITP